MNLDSDGMLVFPSFLGFVLIPYFLPYFKVLLFNRRNNKSTIVPAFEPPKNLPPLICNMLYSQYSADPYASTFLNLVERGVITVVKKGTNYELILNKPVDGLFNFEKLFLDMIFGDKQSLLMSEISSSLFKIGKLYKAAFTDLNALGISESKYKFALGQIILIGLILNIIYVLIGNPMNPVIFVMINMLIAPALASYALPYPKLTEYGKTLAHEAAGFRLFLTNVQKYRAQFDEKNSLFYNFLPYAVLYRLANIWMQNVNSAMFEFDGKDKSSMKFIEVYANGKNILNSEPTNSSE